MAFVGKQTGSILTTPPLVAAATTDAERSVTGPQLTDDKLTTDEIAH